jgi:putative ABC transport system permease protein
MEGIWQDLRFAVRSLARARGFSLLAVSTLAVAIAANTAMFSVFYTVLLKPLPYSDPESLYLLWEDASPRGPSRDTPAVANYVDWRDQSRRFADMAAVSTDSFKVTGAGEPEQVSGATVTANLLSVLGSRPELGRGFADGEDRAGAQPVVLLSHDLWQRLFGADPGVVGRSLTLDGRPHTVVGVMPRAFQFPSSDTELWTPFALDAEQRQNRSDHYLLVVGRLAVGASAKAAQAEMRDIAARLATAFPDTNTNLSCLVEPLREFYAGDLRPALVALMAAVGFVLLVACTNVASLLLARGMRRVAELRLRAALGAGRGRLTRLVVTESLLLAGTSAAIGLGIAALAVAALARYLPSSLGADRLAIDAPIVGFTLVAALLTSLLFGLLPAQQASGLDLAPGLREGGRGAMGGGRRARSLLVVSEVALSLCLLIGAGLMLRSLLALSRAPIGFDGRHTLLVHTPLSGERYRSFEARLRFFDEVLARVRRLPGVVAAGYTSHVPLTWGGDQNTVMIEGQPVPAPGERHIVPVRVVTPDYFRAVATPLVAGRGFDDRDTVDAERVALVNASFARRFWPGGDAVGRRIQRGVEPSPLGWLRVVGVVEDTPQVAVERAAKAEVYLPYSQWRGNFYVPRDLVVRTQQDPMALAAAVRAGVRAVDPGQPVSSAARLDSVVADALAERRLQSGLFVGFAVVALLLAAVGLFGVLSQIVSQRERELGVRVALGARARDVLRLVLGDALRLVAVGSVLGILGYLGLARFLSHLLYGVGATDTATIGTVTALLGTVALASASLPAWRATRVDPASVLRQE